MCLNSCVKDVHGHQPAPTDITVLPSLACGALQAGHTGPHQPLTLSTRAGMLHAPQNIPRKLTRIPPFSFLVQRAAAYPELFGPLVQKRHGRQHQRAVDELAVHHPRQERRALHRLHSPAAAPSLCRPCDTHPTFAAGALAVRTTSAQLHQEGCLDLAESCLLILFANLVC